MILNAIVLGEGQPVLLLHGLFGAARNLGALARGLAATHKTIALDARNHGDSPHAPEMTYAGMAADVLETAATLGIKSAAVMGHSMGGKMAMALALTQRHFVTRLAVLDIAPVAYGHAYDDYVAAMRHLALSPSLTRQAADAAFAEVAPEPSMRAFLLNNLVLGAAPRWRIGLDEIAGAMPDLVGWADPPDTQPYPGPALFLRGGNSDYVTEAATTAITARFPAGVQKTIDGAGHWLHAEKPGPVIAALKEFLSP
jgi:esterase